MGLQTLREALSEEIGTRGLLKKIQYHRIGEKDDLQFDSLRAFSGILPAALCTGAEESAEGLAKKLRAFVNDHKTKENTT